VAPTKIPATALLLQQAQTGTMTISLILTIDGIGFAAVILFNVLASRIQNVPFSSIGLPVNAKFGKRLFQGFAWGILIASLVIGVTFLLGGLRFDGFALSTAECFKYGFVSLCYHVSCSGIQPGFSGSSPSIGPSVVHFDWF
jgi:hypothetical protein